MISNFSDTVTNDIHLILNTSKAERGRSLELKGLSLTITGVSLAAIRLVGVALMGASAYMAISAIPSILFTGQVLRLALGIMTFAVGHDVFLASRNISESEVEGVEGVDQPQELGDIGQGLLLRPIVEPLVYRFLKDHLSAKII